MPLRRILFSALFLIIFGISIYFIDGIFKPIRSNSIKVPFSTGQCLRYEYNSQNQGALQEKVCFTISNDGSFQEQKDAQLISYNKDGYANLIDINDPLFKMVFKGSNPIDQSRINNTKIRTIYYAQPNLAVGTIFYDGYPVKEWTNFNNQPVYVVEQNPHIDTYLQSKGPIHQRFLLFSYKYNKLVYKYKQTEKQAHNANVVRYYYNRTTGILEGRESLLINYDQDWKEIESKLENKLILQSE